MDDTLKGIRVLVVEDDDDTRELLRVLLETQGGDVTATSCVQEALSAYDRSLPHVIVADIGMPNEDGYSLMRRVRELPAQRGGAVPAIALTAYARAEDRRRALEAGFHLHVPKPVLPSDLVLAVARLQATAQGAVRAVEE